MLINLSNHPSVYWSERQMSMARERWGQVIDLSFPALSPTLTTAEVLVIAEEYKGRCVDMLRNSADEVSAVHLMGEIVFCFRLVQLLKDAGVMVVASAAERDVSYTNDVKNSIFNFVTFREY